MSGFDIFAWIFLIILVASVIAVFCIAGWLPAGNRTNDRANVADNSPKRRSSLASAVSFSTSASRRQTQLLCRPSSSAASI